MLTKVAKIKSNTITGYTLRQEKRAERRDALEEKLRLWMYFLYQKGNMPEVEQDDDNDEILE